MAVRLLLLLAVGLGAGHIRNFVNYSEYLYELSVPCRHASSLVGGVRSFCRRRSIAFRSYRTISACKVGARGEFAVVEPKGGWGKRTCLVFCSVVKHVHTLLFHSIPPRLI